MKTFRQYIEAKENDLERIQDTLSKKRGSGQFQPIKKRTHARGKSRRRQRGGSNKF